MADLSEGSQSIVLGEHGRESLPHSSRKQKKDGIRGSVAVTGAAVVTYPHQLSTASQTPDNSVI